MNLRSPFPHSHFAVVWLSGGRLRVELYIRSIDDGVTEEVFGRFVQAKDEIEAAFGEALEWDNSARRRARVIAVYHDADIADVDSHSEYVEWILKTLERLRDALAAPSIDFTNLDEG